jgi:hypothetical protein
MGPPTNNLGKGWIEHRLYAKIPTDITTRNKERKDEHKKKKISNLVRTTRFWNNAQIRKIAKPNNL